MKALTVRQPYATLIMIGAKPYEFRTWPTEYRGPIAIHAGAAMHSLWSEQILTSRAPLEAAGFSLPAGLPRAVVLGTVDLVGCVKCRDHVRCRDLSEAQLIHCGSYDGDMYAWILENPRPLETPIAAKGLQGLWNWTEVQP